MIKFISQILNQSIDFLIGNKDENTLMRQCHKFGFHNPDDFLLASRNMAKHYRLMCCSERDIDDQSMFSPELQNIIKSVYSARKEEIIRFIIREQNSNDCPLVKSFDWDVRLVLGDSSFDRNFKILINITLSLSIDLQSKSEYYIQFQVNRNQINEFIKRIELALKDM